MNTEVDKLTSAWDVKEQKWKYISIYMRLKGRNAAKVCEVKMREGD